MKRYLSIALFAIASMCSAPFAHAASHGGEDRIATKALLSAAVESYCTSTTSECTVLRRAAADLYQDPFVVTKDDIERIDVLKASLAGHSVFWRIRFAEVRNHLVAAVERAEFVTFHVVYMHDGKWDQFEICKTPS